MRACKPKGCQFDSQSGHMPGLWARSPVRAHEWQPHIDVSFLPFSSVCVCVCVCVSFKERAAVSPWKPALAVTTQVQLEGLHPPTSPQGTPSGLSHCMKPPVASRPACPREKHMDHSPGAATDLLCHLGEHVISLSICRKGNGQRKSTCILEKSPG